MSPESVSPLKVAKILRLKHGSVKKAMRRLHENGEIDRELHGLYRTLQMDVVNQIPYERLKIHGIKIEFQEGKGMKAPPFLWDASKVTSPPSPLAEPDVHIHSRNKGATVKKYFQGRRATVTIHCRKKKIELFLKCGKTDEALDHIEFCAFCGWVEGLFGFPLSWWQLVQYGFNYDFHPFRLEIPTYTSLQLVKDYWTEVYQKEKDVVRVGVHGVAKIPLDKQFEFHRNMLKALQQEANHITQRIKVEK